MSFAASNPPMLLELKELMCPYCKRLIAPRIRNDGTILYEHGGFDESQIEMEGVVADNFCPNNWRTWVMDRYGMITAEELR
jgi:hypothetical protein